MPVITRTLHHTACPGAGPIVETILVGPVPSRPVSPAPGRPSAASPPYAPISPCTHLAAPSALLSSLAFKPTPEQSEQILTNLASANHSFLTIAEDHHTTIEALTLWISRPEIRARLDALEYAFSRRLRLIVANRSEGVLSTLTRVLDQFQYAEGHINDSTLRGAELKRKDRETAIKAAHLLVRLTKFFPLPAPDASPTSAQLRPARTTEAADSSPQDASDAAPSHADDSTLAASNSAPAPSPHKYPAGPRARSTSRLDPAASHDANPSSPSPRPLASPTNRFTPLTISAHSLRMQNPGGHAGATVASVHTTHLPRAP